MQLFWEVKRVQILSRVKHSHVVSTVLMSI